MKAGIAILLLIVFLGIAIYSVYDTFFIKNSSPYSIIFVIFFVVLIIFMIISIILAKLSEAYPNSKFLKWVKNTFDKLSHMILDGFSGA